MGGRLEGHLGEQCEGLPVCFAEVGISTARQGFWTGSLGG